MRASARVILRVTKVSPRIGTFVVEQDPVAGEEAVGLAVVHRDPVGVELGHRVGRARIEGRGLLLRHLLHQAVELRGRGLVEARAVAQPQDADRLQHAQRAQRVRVGGVLGLLEGHRHVALRREVVDLVGLDLLDDAHQAARVGHVAVVQDEAAIGLVRILVEVVDPVGVEQRGAALDAVHLVAFAEQELGEVGAVLAGDAGDECYAFHRLRWSKSQQNHNIVVRLPSGCVR